MLSVPIKESDYVDGCASPDIRMSDKNRPSDEAYPLPVKNRKMQTQNVPPKIQEFAQSIQMPVQQVNGQRILGPSIHNSELPPGTGSEVFLTRLPRDCFEDELWKVFQNLGAIYQIRMMMNFSGTNRGYCFIKFFTAQIARVAVRDYDNYEIRTGQRIRVMRSIDNRRLVLEGLPNRKNLGELRLELQEKIQGYSNVYVEDENGRPLSSQDQLISFGIAFLEFPDHRMAAVTRGNIFSLAGGLVMWGLSIKVNWAYPYCPGRLWISKNKNNKWNRSMRVNVPQNLHLSPDIATVPDQPCPCYSTSHVQPPNFNFLTLNWETNSVMNPIWQSNGIANLQEHPSVGQPLMEDGVCDQGGQRFEELSSVIYSPQPQPSAYVPIHILPYAQDPMITYVENAPYTYQQACGASNYYCGQYDYPLDDNYSESTFQTGYFLRDSISGNYYDCVYY